MDQIWEIISPSADETIVTHRSNNSRPGISNGFATQYEVLGAYALGGIELFQGFGEPE